MRKGAGAFLWMLFVACSSSPVPKGVLLPAKMCATLQDVMQADEYINNFGFRDTSINIKQRRSDLYTQVFALHNTDRKQFYKSYTYYQQHPDLMKALFDSLSLRLKKKELKKIILPVADTSLK